MENSVGIFHQNFYWFENAEKIEGGGGVGQATKGKYVALVMGRGKGGSPKPHAPFVLI